MKTTVTQLQPATTFVLNSFFITKISNIFFADVIGGCDEGY
jgi:hypothetical protein